MQIDHAEFIRQALTKEPQTAKELAINRGVSQATMSRALNSFGDKIIRFGDYQSIHYSLRRPLLPENEFNVYRVNNEGQVAHFGVLAPVFPHGFVLTDLDGKTSHSEGFPWYLDDMRPQGFLGRALAQQYAAQLNLPMQVNDWHEAHIFRALLSVAGADSVGDFILGDVARTHFLQQLPPLAIAENNIPKSYQELAKLALQGEIAGSSAGGEQAKFTAFVDQDLENSLKAAHVLVKFSLPMIEVNPAIERWQDLLLAEHLALLLLNESENEYGVKAAKTRMIDFHGQRFLEVTRFDRFGAFGRRGLASLAALDAEFLGIGSANWAVLCARLAEEKIISSNAFLGAQFLYAFGTLIGNTDMHAGNLSFFTDGEKPYALSPIYDMLPMAFAPERSGQLPCTIPIFHAEARVAPKVWRAALLLAREFMQKIKKEPRFSPRFLPCLQVLEAHLTAAEMQIARLL